MTDAPHHALANEARLALAGLLLENDDRPPAAATYQEIAQSDAAHAADALAVLADLFADAPAALRPVLERLIREFPQRLPDAAARLARLAVTEAAPASHAAPGAGVFFGFAPR